MWVKICKICSTLRILIRVRSLNLSMNKNLVSNELKTGGNTSTYIYPYFRAEDWVNPDWPKMTRAIVFENGQVDWYIAGQFVTRCDVNMKKFPFDTQECTIEIGPFGLSALYLNATAVAETSFPIDVYSPSEEFELIANSTETKLMGNSSDPKLLLASALFKITLARRSDYYVLNIILPCSLLAILSLVTFCLPVSSGERVSLQITVLLSQSVYQLILTNYVPVTSINMPILSEYQIR